jgi:hypothetical protein
MQFPVNLNLHGRPVLVVGGGRIAYRKVEQLLMADAEVTVLSPMFVDEFHSLPVTLVQREYASGDIDAMTAEDAARERLVVGLRRRDGIHRQAFRAASGHDVDVLAGVAIADWVAQGLATDDGDQIRLTRAGMLVSDGLWSAVLVK